MFDGIEVDKITRFEIIDQHGRVFVMLDAVGGVGIALQDDGRTLKVFVQTDHNTGEAHLAIRRDGSEHA